MSLSREETRKLAKNVPMCCAACGAILPPEWWKHTDGECISGDESKKHHEGMHDVEAIADALHAAFARETAALTRERDALHHDQLDHGLCDEHAARLNPGVAECPMCTTMRFWKAERVEHDQALLDLAKTLTWIVSFYGSHSAAIILELYEPVIRRVREATALPPSGPTQDTP